MSVDATLERLKALYYGATAGDHRRRLRRGDRSPEDPAGEEDRERAAVYMEGLAEMKREFGGGRAPRRREATAPKRRP